MIPILTGNAVQIY